MITALLMSAATLFAAPAAATKYEWKSPDAPFVKGVAYPVAIEIQTEQEVEISAWLLEPAGFTINGQPLQKRGNDKLRLPAGAKLSLNFDLAPLLNTEAQEFRLGWGGDKGGPERTVACLQAAPAGLDFMQLPAEELSNYQVLLVTNRGTMRCELWPDVAPNHVRNFLDLSYTGFYNATQFHRVSPSFMIQGGDPNTRGENQAGWGMGNGPRMVKAEFNARKHEKGVLSMARGPDKDSASCQFFVMTGVSPHLDGKYSAFGKLLDGLSTLDAIANAKGTGTGDGTIRPKEPQRIERAVVIRAPSKK